MPLFLATVLVAPSLGEAGSGTWTTGGPYGAPVQVFAVDPTNSSTVYAGTSNGIYRSGDGGQTWSQTGETASVHSVAIDPGTPTTLYTGTDCGVSKSTNSGGDWVAVNTGLPSCSDLLSFSVLSIAVDGINPNTLYAGTERGAFKSTNAGSTWTPASNGLPVGALGRPVEILQIVIDPTSTSRLYARASDSILTSTDAGATWGPTNFYHGGPKALVVASGSPSTLYASSSHGWAVWKSTDSGSTWSSANGGLPLDEEFLRLPTGFLAVDPVTPSTLFVTTEEGIYKTTNGGGFWTESNAGLPSDGSVSTLGVAPGGQTVFAGGTRTAYRSIDAGETWVESLEGMVGPSISALALTPSSTVYAGGTSVHASSASGTSWNAGSEVAGGKQVASLVVDPVTPSTVYAATEAGVAKSVDSGVTWLESNSGLPPDTQCFALAIDAADPATLYAATASGLFKSTNGAAAWAMAGATLPPNSSVRGVAIDPVNTATVYASVVAYSDNSATGLYRSIDGGDSWQKTALQWPGTVLIDSIHPTTLYSRGGFDDDTIWRSTDSGGTWSDATTGLPRTPSGHVIVYALALDPSSPSTLYATARDGLYPREGFYRSTDGGSSWARFGPVPPRAIRAIVVDPSTPTTLYAAARSGGVWQYSAPTPTGFYTVTPCRVLDTRDAARGGPVALGAGMAATVAVAGRCGIPQTAKAVAVMLSVTAPTHAGSLTLFAAGSSRPRTSSINYAASQTRSSSSVAGLGQAGGLDVYVGQTSGNAHVILDVSGYLE